MNRTDQITTALASTLEEIGVTGRLEVTSNEDSAGIVLGEPTGNDSKIVVSIEDLDAAD